MRLSSKPKYLETLLVVIPFLSISFLSVYFQTHNSFFRLKDEYPTGLNASPWQQPSFPEIQELKGTQCNTLYLPFNLFCHIQERILNFMRVYIEQHAHGAEAWAAASNCSILLAFFRLMSQTDGMVVILLQSCIFSLLFAYEKSRQRSVSSAAPSYQNAMKPSLFTPFTKLRSKNKYRYYSLLFILFFVESYETIVETLCIVGIALVLRWKYLKRVNELELVSIMVAKGMFHSYTLRCTFIAFLLSHELKFGFLLRMGWMLFALGLGTDWQWVGSEIFGLKFWAIGLYWLAFLVLICWVMFHSNPLSVAHSRRRTSSRDNTESDEDIEQEISLPRSGTEVTQMMRLFAFRIEKILYRKFFHFVALFMFFPVIFVDIIFMVKSFEIALSAFLMFESLRVIEDSTAASIMHAFLSRFTDERDESDNGSLLILTHIYLLVGCIMPCWVYIHQPPMHHNSTQQLYPFIGLVSLCVGDSVASIFGVIFGKTKMWGIQTTKTVEGMTASIVFQALSFLFVLFVLQIPLRENLIPAIGTAVFSGMFETATDEIDNLVLPVYSCAVFELLLNV